MIGVGCREGEQESGNPPGGIQFQSLENNPGDTSNHNPPSPMSIARAMSPLIPGLDDYDDRTWASGAFDTEPVSPLLSDDASQEERELPDPTGDERWLAHPTHENEMQLLHPHPTHENEMQLLHPHITGGVSPEIIRKESRKNRSEDIPQNFPVSNSG
jgi:hypothetical protein